MNVVLVYSATLEEAMLHHALGQKKESDRHDQQKQEPAKFEPR